MEPSVFGGSPFIKTLPEVGEISPAMQESKVLFPQPDGPTMLTNSFSYMSKLIFETADISSRGVWYLTERFDS